MQVFRELYQSFFLVVCVFVLVACTASQRVVKTYEGQTLPEEQLTRLEVRENIKVTEIDGIKQKTYLLDNLALTYSLLPGEHTIVYRYYSIWSRARDSKDADESKVDRVQSELRQIRMVFKPAKTYFFSFPQPSDKREAAQLAKQFSAIVIDEKGNKVVADSAYSSPATVELPTNKNKSLLSPVTQTSGITAVQQPAGQQIKPAAESSVIPAMPTTTRSAESAESLALASKTRAIAPVDTGLSRLDAIKVLWSKASAEEKKEFLRWAFQ
jgi:uncharacterized protein YccT (UPF0319 family)